MPSLLLLLLLSCVHAEEFPSLITSNASLAVVLDREYLGDQYQPLLNVLKEHIKELVRVRLVHGGVHVHYYSWSTISLGRGMTAVLAVCGCEAAWELWNRAIEQRLAIMVVTQADCPRLPTQHAVTAIYAPPGEELPQLLLDLRTHNAFRWKSATILHDDTLSRDMVSRVVRALTSTVEDTQVSTISVSVFKMRHEINEYLRRKEMHRVLSSLPVKHIGERFIAVVTSDVMSTMAGVARELRMSHARAQWLYVVSDTDATSTNISAHIDALYEGENVAYLYNHTENLTSCKDGIDCYCKEILEAFILALDAAVQEEMEIAAQVSDEEWEAIRPTKSQRRDFLLRHMQQHVKVTGKCGNCSRWEALAADTWGATYTTQTKHVLNDSKTDNTIEEIRLLEVGFWRPLDSISFSDVLFPHVEHGFRGKALPIVTFHNPPWTILQKNETGAVVGRSGLVFDVLDQIAINMNFTIDLKLIEVKEQESINSLNDTMGSNEAASLQAQRMVAEGLVAIGASAFTVMFDQPAGINYTYAISSQPHAFMLARPRALSRALLFMSPFSPDTWACLAASVVLMGPALYIVHRLSPYYDTEPRASRAGLSTIHNCLWYMYGALLQQGGMHLPAADSGRLVIGTWWLVVLVVVTTYSGNLVAFLTFPKQEIPPSTVSELVDPLSAYSWSYTHGSYLEILLKDSEEPKYKTLNKGSDSGTGETGVQVERARGSRHAIVDWKLRLRYLMRADHLATDSCDFTLSSEEFLEERVAMLVPSKSPYLTLIDREINQMQRAGLILAWLRRYEPPRDRCSVPTAYAINHTVNMDDMQGSFIVLLLGWFIAGSVLAVEFCLRRPRISKAQQDRPYLP